MYGKILETVYCQLCDFDACNFLILSDNGHLCWTALSDRQPIIVTDLPLFYVIYQHISNSTRGPMSPFCWTCSLTN